MKILICGMPRSMTTWAFNAVRELLAGQHLRFVWVESEADIAEADFATTEDNVLAKCHHYSERLATAADFIIYSYRDIRTAAVSCHRKFNSPCTQIQLDAWVSAGQAWGRKADVVLRYESVAHRPLEALHRLRQELVVRFGQNALVALDDEEVLHLILPSMDGHPVKRVKFATEVNHEQAERNGQVTEALFAAV